MELNLETIPSELLLHIATFINLEEYLVLSQVSSKINICLTYGRYTDRNNNLKTKCINELKKQLSQVKKSGFSIEHIKNPSETIQLYAVKEKGHAIRYIINPSEQIQLAAVKNFSLSISYIENPSEQVQLAAVEKNPYSYNSIKEPCEKVRKLMEKN